MRPLSSPRTPISTGRSWESRRFDQLATHVPVSIVEAVFGGDVAAVAGWLDSGGDVDAAYGGATLLIHASSAGQALVVELLIRRGATLLAKDKWGRTALACALAEGNEAVVKLLQRRSIAPMETAMEAQLSKFEASIVAALEKKFEAKLEAAMLAADARVEDRVRTALQTPDKQLRLVASRGTSAELLKAVFDGDLETVTMWLEGGGKVNAAYDGATLLIHASSVGQALVVELLIRHGARIEATDKYGRTALACALAEGNEPDVVRLLLRAGAQKSLVDPGILAVSRVTARECFRVLDEPPGKLTEFYNKMRDGLR